MKKKIEVCLMSIVLFLMLAVQGAQAQGTFKPTRFSVVLEGKETGPDLIYIPGLASSRANFEREAKVIAPVFHIHLLQIAGFAGEPAGPNMKGEILKPVVEELHQYITQNHIQHPYLVGHSLGGLISLMLSIEYPTDAGKVLIIDALPFYGLTISPEMTVEKMRKQAEAMYDDLITESAREFNEGEHQFASSLSASKEGQTAITEAAYKSERRVIAETLLEDLTTDLRAHLAEIKVPVTVMYPYAVSQGPREKTDELYHKAYADLKQAKFLTIENSLHFVMYDQPLEFHNAFVEFLKSK